MTLMSSAALGRHGRHGRPFSATIFRTTVDLPIPGGPVKINAAGLRYWYTPRSITSASFSCSKIGLVVISDVPSVNTGSFALLLGRVSLLCHGGLGWRLFFNRGIASNAAFSIIDGKAFEMASAGQCGFIQRNELLLVNYVGKFAGLKPDPPSVAVFPHGHIGVHRVGQPLAWPPLSARSTTQTPPSACPTNQSTSPR